MGQPPVAEIKNGIFSQGERRSGIERIHRIVKDSRIMAEGYMLLVKATLPVGDLLIEMIIRSVEHE